MLSMTLIFLKILLRYIPGSSRVFYAKIYFEEMLKLDDMNVIFVDWERGATFPYYQAAGDTRIVGRFFLPLVI